MPHQRFQRFDYFTSRYVRRGEGELIKYRETTAVDKWLIGSIYDINIHLDGYKSTLTHSLIHHFETVPNSKKLQTTTEMWLLKDFEIQIA